MTPMTQPGVDPGPAYVVVSQMFPPAVGGSGVLLENVYARVANAPVTAVIDRATCGRTSHPRMQIVATTIDAHAWSLTNPASLAKQMRLASTLYGLSRGGRAILHCGRAQPEGISAFLASFLPGGAPYVFWAHGEDISAALSSRQFATTMKLVYRRASAAIANSKNTARLIASTGWHTGPIEVVYPGVDSRRFTPDAARGTAIAAQHPPALTLLSVARIQRRKGHDLVIRALPALRQRVPALRYVIVGGGPERGNLERLAAELGVTDLVFFAGEVPDDDLPAYFAACDIFVLPTRVDASDFEGFGIVFLEAAAAGKPSIGGRNGGVPEAIVEGETGMLVDADDLEGLTRSLLTLAENRELLTRMGTAGRERAVRDFSWEQAAEAVSGIHERIAAARRT
jgi:phosphatidylinositol alpha-1,6-mannosyltransferase